MRRTERKTVSVEQDELVDVICNRCGESCMEPAPPDGKRVVRGGNFAIAGGYGDAFPPDMERWSFDLCEPCLGWIVSTFKHYPSTSQLSFASGAPEEGFPSDPCSWSFSLLHDGKPTDDTPAWVIERYVLAMGKAVPPHLAEEVSTQLAKASAATDLAARTLEAERKKHHVAFDDVWSAVEALLPPVSSGEKKLLEQAQSLVASTVEKRVLDRVRELTEALRWAQSKMGGEDYMKNYELLRMTELFLESIDTRAT